MNIDIVITNEDGKIEDHIYLNFNDPEIYNLTPAQSLGSLYRFSTGYEYDDFDNLTDMSEDHFNNLFYAGQREFNLTRNNRKTYVKMGEYDNGYDEDYYWNYSGGTSR